jgi:DNA-binding MarR family transcriptional regulator
MTRPDHPVCTCEALRRLTRRMTLVYDHHLAETGLTVGQYSLLVNIGAEPLPLSQLARRVATDRTTLSRTLVPLIDAGWVALRRGTDGRVRLVALTQAGSRKAAAARRIWQRAQDQIETTLSPALTGSLHAMVAKAMARLRPFVPDN